MKAQLSTELLLILLLGAILIGWSARQSFPSAPQADCGIVVGDLENFGHPFEAKISCRANNMTPAGVEYKTYER